MAQTAEELARLSKRVVPTLVTILREARSMPAGRDNPRAEMIDMFENAPRRPALLARLDVVEGTLGADEYIRMVNQAMLQL